MPNKLFSQKSFFLIIYINLFSCILAQTLWAYDIHWLEIETKHTIIRYHAEKDLIRFNNNVAYSPNHVGLKRTFSRLDNNPLINRVVNKVGTLYERVKEILGMYKSMDKLVIHIYQDQEQLHTAYYKIYGRVTRLRAWYIFERNTIYIQLNDLHEGLLAHEMAHAIIDNYLTVRPPTASAEILARYVDEYLMQ